MQVLKKPGHTIEDCGTLQATNPDSRASIVCQVYQNKQLEEKFKDQSPEQVSSIFNSGESHSYNQANNSRPSTIQDKSETCVWLLYGIRRLVHRISVKGIIYFIARQMVFIVCRPFIKRGLINGRYIIKCMFI